MWTDKKSRDSIEKNQIKIVEMKTHWINLKAYSRREKEKVNLKTDQYKLSILKNKEK